MTVGVLVPAAGRGERLGGGPKALRSLAGEPLLLHAVRRLRAAAGVGPVVVAAPPDRLAEVRRLLSDQALVVAGGADRHESVAAALAALPPEADLVLVHDAARCLVPVDVVGRVIAALHAGAPAVVPVVPLPDTVKQVDGHAVVRTLARGDLRAVQTPQGFARAVLERAHADATGPATDDAALVEALGVPVSTVPGAPEGFKITGPLDLVLAEALVGRG